MSPFTISKSPLWLAACVLPMSVQAFTRITAELEGLTLYWLRRSFKSLTAWLEVPVGVYAQIQGHKPSATAEMHYTVRPLELLALHHELLEAWILKQTRIVFDAAEPEISNLRAVAA